MPLIKSTSKEAFKRNIKTEMAHGKPQKQAVAIAYSEKRAASKGSKGKALEKKLKDYTKNHRHPTGHDSTDRLFCENCKGKDCKC